MRRFFSFFCSVLVIAVVFFFYYMRLTMSESLNFSKTDPAYFLLVPQIIQGVPVVSSGKPQFYYSSGDGSKPSMIGIEYIVETKDRSQVEASLVRYAESLGGKLNEYGVFELPDKKFISLTFIGSPEFPDQLTARFTLNEL
jgi:hypothetical protein